MDKIIMVTMPDNSKWKIPCKVIAENRAYYYSVSSDKKRPFDEVYEETMLNDDLLLGWGEESMDWTDLKQYAEMVEPPNVDYKDGWLNGHKKIYEV